MPEAKFTNAQNKAAGEQTETAEYKLKNNDTCEPPSEPGQPRLRVLVFTIVFPSPWSPLHGTFVFERIRHLTELADIRVVSPVPWFQTFRRQHPLPQVTSAVPTKYLRFWYVPKVLFAFRGCLLFVSALREVARLRQGFDFDLIDAHFAYPDGFAAVLLGRWFRRPVCITLRGTIIPISKRRMGRWVCNWAIRRAERVIAVAENLADRARDGGVSEDRLSVISNGVDGARFKLIDRVVARRLLGLANGQRLIVSIGHLSPRKGFQRVIRSLPHVIKSCPEARLAIVGGKGAENNNSAELHTLRANLGLADHVVFVGPESPDRVALWLGAADIFALASDFEGCPNVILEAMACGRPVVATKVGEIERMVPGFAGCLIDDPNDNAALADALIIALTRDWDASRIRDHAASRSWDDVAGRVATQWQLAVEAFSAQGPVRPGVSSAKTSSPAAALSPEL